MRMDISNGWSFEEKRVSRRWLSHSDGATGNTVDLPHSWNDHDTFQEGLKYRRGWGSYRRTFTAPDAAPGTPGTRWHLCSEGFYGRGDVWLNGRKAAEVDGQYLGFRIDVTEHLLPGATNTVGIRLSNRHSVAVLPGIRDPDFLLHGGLAGRVWIEALPPVHVCRTDLWTSGGWSQAEGGLARCVLSVVNNGGVTARVTARVTIRDGAGLPIAQADTVVEAGPRSSSGAVDMKLAVPSATPWSPDSPSLYSLAVALLSDGATCDEMVRRIGFRNAEFRRGEGFFLNGVRTHLHGCNRHESMPGFGQALPPSLHIEDAASIRRFGMNFVRLSHYPQHQTFLDACDEEGILVYAEIATWKSVRGYGRWLKSACRQMRDMILRDRWHPSIILWGMGNEERSRRAFTKLQSVARELDPERPTIYAENHLHRAVRRRTTGIPDVWGTNYELDLVAEGADSSRSGSAIVTEMSNYPPARRGDPRRELEQVSLIEADIGRLRVQPCTAGFALWCWNDYATMRKSRYARNCGMVDAWRIPKAAAWLMAALYAPRPMVRLVGDWSRGGQPEREIHVFSNCPDIALSIEGQPVMRLGGKPHSVARVQYRPAPLEAVAAGPAGTARCILPPHGACVGLAVEPERPTAPSSDRETVAFLLRATDSEGCTVTDWSGLVPVHVSGPARLRAYTPSGEVMVSAGIGRGFVTGTGQPGTACIAPSGQDLRLSAGEVLFAD
jgi:beta-galactosidase